MTTERKKHHPVRRAKQAQAAPQKDQGGARRYGAAKKPNEIVEVQAPRRERRALSHVGGEVLFEGGSDEEQAALTLALDVSSSEDEVMEDVHGFHSYPARLHPMTARGLIEGLSKPGDKVLDPFCGSGTVVVEARALGREAIGSDLNPLAVELAWLKSRGPNQKVVEEMVAAAGGIADVAEERRLNKSEPHRRYGDDERQRYPIHILLELDSLANSIHQLAKPELTRMLRLVISSTLTKLSHSEGDTTRQRSQRRLPSGYAIQLFHQKAEELARRLNAYRERLPVRAPRAYVGCSDARALEKIESDSINLVITSPPYPGVYDYLDHHLHRIQFLGLREGALRDMEIGARREYRNASLEEAAQRWRNEIGPTLNEIRRTLTDDGRGVMIIADSVVDRQPLYADEQIRRVADKAGIDITCVASQERPIFLHGAERAFQERPRMEHVVIFRPKVKRKKLTREEEILKAAAEARDARERSSRIQKYEDDREEAEFERQEAEELRAKESGLPAPERPQTASAPRRDFAPRGDSAPRRDFAPRGDAAPRREFSPRGDAAPRREFSGSSPGRRFEGGERSGSGRSSGNRFGREEREGGFRGGSPVGGARREGGFGDRPAPGAQRREGGFRGAQRDNQDRTWDSRPSGAGRPKSKPGWKPK